MNALGVLTFYLKRIGKYKKYFFLNILMIIIISTEPSIYGYLKNIIIDKLSGSSNFGPNMVYLILFGGIVFIYEITHVLKIWIQRKSVPYVNKNIVLYLYDTIQSKDYSFFKKNTSGVISSRIRTVVGNFDDLLTDISDAFITNPFKIITCSFFIFIIDKNIGFLILFFLALFVLFCTSILSRLGKATYLAENNYNNIISKINDRLLNITTIFAFSSFDKEKRLLKSDLEKDYVPCQEKIYKYELLFHFVGGTTYTLMFFCPIVYSIFLYSKGLVTIGNVIAIWTYSTSISVAIWELLRSFQFIVEEMNELKSSLNGLIDEGNKKKENLIQINTDFRLDSSPEIEFRDVCFSYNEESGENVLEKFNIKIEKGQKVGIVGESGTGKTTLFNLLLKYNENYSGEILINGENIKNIDTDYIRKNISIIPQNTILFNRSILENIKYNYEDCKDEEVYDICKKLRIHEGILKSQNGYNSSVGEMGSNLSGGQRQRISIARALIKKSKILLLDEPTSALDAITEKHFQESLEYLIKECKCTTIVIAHKLLTLVNMDKIIVLQNGQITEIGTHDELKNIENSYYKKLWDIQVCRNL